MPEEERKTFVFVEKCESPQSNLQRKNEKIEKYSQSTVIHISFFYNKSDTLKKDLVFFKRFFKALFLRIFNAFLGLLNIGTCKKFKIIIS